MLRSPIAKFAPALAALTFALTASAGLKSHGAHSVKFYAKGTVPGLSIDGKGDKLAAVEEDGKIKVRASLCNLKTGIGMRDKDLRKFLKVDCGGKVNHEAVLEVEKSKLTFPKDKEVSGKAKGKFTLAGVTLDQDFSYTAKPDGGGFAVTGKMVVDSEKHAKDKASYMGVGVHKDVRVEVSFKLK
jgi:hypothetical protein